MTTPLSAALLVSLWTAVDGPATACETAHDKNACVHAAVKLLDKGADEAKRGLQLLQEQCAAGNEFGCNELANAHILGRGTPKNGAVGTAIRLAWCEARGMQNRVCNPFAARGAEADSIVPHYRRVSASVGPYGVDGKRKEAAAQPAPVASAPASVAPGSAAPPAPAAAAPVAAPVAAPPMAAPPAGISGSWASAATTPPPRMPDSSYVVGDVKGRRLVVWDPFALTGIDGQACIAGRIERAQAVAEPHLRTWKGKLTCGSKTREVEPFQFDLVEGIRSLPLATSLHDKRLALATLPRGTKVRVAERGDDGTFGAPRECTTGTTVLDKEGLWRDPSGACPRAGSVELAAPVEKPLGPFTSLKPFRIVRSPGFPALQGLDCTNADWLLVGEGSRTHEAKSIYCDDGAVYSLSLDHKPMLRVEAGWFLGRPPLPPTKGDALPEPISEEQYARFEAMERFEQPRIAAKSKEIPAAPGFARTPAWNDVEVQALDVPRGKRLNPGTALHLVVRGIERFCSVMEGFQVGAGLIVGTVECEEHVEAGVEAELVDGLFRRR